MEQNTERSMDHNSMESCWKTMCIERYVYTYWLYKRHAILCHFAQGHNNYYVPTIAHQRLLCVGSLRVQGTTYDHTVVQLQYKKNHTRATVVVPWASCTLSAAVSLYRSEA